MRFDDLFADLEAQASAQAQRELWDEAQELSRAERGRLDLGDRLRAGRQWRLRLAGGHGCAGRLLRVEADCLVLDQGGEQWCLRWPPFAPRWRRARAPRRAQASASGRRRAQRRSSYCPPDMMSRRVFARPRMRSKYAVWM